MDGRGKPSLSELKVGIFVVVTSGILGMAIFTIGTQVGLFEETFFAKTYLNNVSGLKPGDIVLLAGVEVGNVIDVRISEAGQLPITESNQRFLQVIDELTENANAIGTQIADSQQDLAAKQVEYERVVGEQGSDSRAAQRLGLELESIGDILESQRIRLEDAGEDIGIARGNLQNIELRMQIKSDYRGWIREDSNISLGSIGLLGDKYVEISLGRTLPAPPVLEETVDSWTGTATREVVVITGTTQPGFQELITGADDVLANLETLSDRLTGILVSLSEGEGSVGQFITNASFYENLNETITRAASTVDEATRLIGDLRQGEGTIARLVQEDVVYEQIRQSSDRLESVLARIEQGEGTLGKIVNDPSLFQKSARVAANIESITGRIEAGEGTLGKLSTDDQLYVDMQRSLDRFAAFVGDVEEGRGTLGRLAKDEELYQNLNLAFAEGLKLLYDFRQNPRKFLTIKLELF